LEEKKKEKEKVCAGEGERVVSKKEELRVSEGSMGEKGRTC
jgi:hypothetical protein